MIPLDMYINTWQVKSLKEDGIAVISVPTGTKLPSLEETWRLNHNKNTGEHWLEFMEHDCIVFSPPIVGTKISKYYPDKYKWYRLIITEIQKSFIFEGEIWFYVTVKMAEHYE